MRQRGIQYTEDYLREMAEREKYFKQLKDIKQEQKIEKGTKDGKEMHYPGYSVPSSSGNIKQEPKFSLFGYQPFQHSYISTEQLHSYGLADKNRKEEKDSKRSTVSVPPPLIKDNKTHSSVIVDNRVKSTSPRPAHSHHTSSMPSTSPRSQPKPAHTPDRQYDRPMSSLSTNSPLASQQDYMSQSMDLSANRDKHINRDQSPLHVADPHHLSAAITQPLDYHRKHKVQSKSPVSSSSVTASIAQPPVTLTGSMAYTFSLIQQGLVPNPIYSQTSVKAASSTSAQETSPQGVKRKIAKEGNNRKRQKGETPPTSSNTFIPNTTPQIPTNHSPYTTSTVSSSSSSNTFSSITSTYPAAGTGFMDSFKTFVENAVQNAFFQDPELNKGKVLTPPKTTSQTPPATTTSTSSGTENQERRKSDPIQLPTSMPKDESLTLSSSTSSLNSNVALMETINRVANGQLDTDSDTLSAPSPPPNVKSDSSPHKSANHPKLKKAWLQRHSEDKVSTKSPLLTDENSESSIKSEKNEKGEMVKNCYVNLSYISPSKEGGSKSPISALKLPNGNVKEGEENESTTSASETETQVC